MKSLARLNKYFIRYKYRLIFGLLFVIASNLFAVFPAQSVRKVIDLVRQKMDAYVLLTDETSRSQAIESLTQSVIYFSLIILAFALIKGVFMYLMRQTLIVMSRHIEFDLKNDIYKHYQLLPQSFYRNNSTGDLMARISEDVSRVRMYIGPAIMYLMNLSVTIIIVLWAMFSVNVELTFWVLMPLPILSFTIFYVNNLINTRSDAIQAQLSKLTSFVQESFSGIRVIKSFAREKQFEAAYAFENEKYKEKSMSLAKVDAVFFPAMVLLTGLSTLLTIWIGGNMVIDGSLSVGNIAEFVIYVNMLTWPVTSLGWTSSLIQRAAASQQRINAFLDEPIESVKSNTTPFSFTNNLRFNHVSFTYPGKTEPALSDIDFELKKGETIAIIGPTGSGKSTLVQLLVRFIEPSSGSITFDGVPIEKVDKQDYRSSLGYAPQDVFLFSDTIANNILFGVTDSTTIGDERITKAAKQAALHETILQFSMQYQTVVGERGITLSGGQKQRVALARALIKDAELVILDDTLSAVDVKTEHEIMNQLRDVGKERTLIIVSHRASLARFADQILVLDNSRIVEQGKHEQLIQQHGIYSKLYNSLIL